MFSYHQYWQRTYVKTAKVLCGKLIEIAPSHFTSINDMNALRIVYTEQKTFASVNQLFPSHYK